MAIKGLLPGDKIDIKIVQEEANGDAKNYISSVFDVYDDDTFEIYMPQAGGKILLLPVNVRYEFIFTTAAGLFKANGTFIDRSKKDNIYLLKGVLTSELTKFQRRDYYRLDCSIPIMFLGLDDEVGNFDTMSEIKDSLVGLDHPILIRGLGTTLDISGGGLRFSSEKDFDGINYLYLQFEISIGGTKKKVDTVLNLIAKEYSDVRDKYIYRGSFVFKDNNFQDEIIRFIFEEERRIRSKIAGK